MKPWNLYLSIVLSALTTSAHAAGNPMRIDTTSFGPMAQFGAGAIYAPCAFDSHAEECLVDTGSDTSNIQSDSFSDAYPSIGKTTGEGLSGTPTVCDFIQVAQFDLDGVATADQKLVRCQETPGQTSPSAAEGNIAGLSVFSGQVLHFDFNVDTFGMSDGIPAGLTTWPLKIHKTLGHFGFSTLVSGLSVASIVDTGAAISVVDRQFVKKHVDAFKFIQAVSGGVDVNGDPVTMNLYQIQSLSLGDIVLTNVYVMDADFTSIRKFLPGVPLIIGFNVVSQKNWYFDLKRNLWAIY